MHLVRYGASTLVLALGIAAAAPAAAQDNFVVPAGTTRTTPVTVNGTDTLTVETGATLTTTSNPTINWNASSTNIRITNSGTINSTAADGRAIDTSGPGATTRTMFLVNNAGAVIESENDAFRVNLLPSAGIIRIDNFGIIRSTNGGQAIDFDAIASGPRIDIFNYAGGEIRSFGQDAIRPGQGAAITNGGLIFSDGAPNNSFDGIDWQARTGRVTNQSTGVISGLRHGITANNDVNVTNDGIIIGRNGSGVGSDGTGIVTNRGTITGRWDGVSINGDGDGIDIDRIGQVINFGTIEGLTAAGVDSGGRLNSAQGVAMGGGTIDNRAGATIVGGAQGILINYDPNPDGAALALTRITNLGTIRGITGAGIVLVGDFADVITNSGGLIAGGNGVALDMGGGNDTLNIIGDASFIGISDGGTGTDTISLSGLPTDTRTFDPSAFRNFERLLVDSGIWRATAPVNFATNTIAGTLIGNASTLTGTYTLNAGTLIIDQATNATFTGRFTGFGEVEKQGLGTLTLSGLFPDFSGPLRVSAGTLRLAGSFDQSRVVVSNGATVAGNSYVARTMELKTGGTLTIGDSGFGSIMLTGNFLARSGSTVVYDTSGSGAADLIVTPSALIEEGARLLITRDSTPYTIGRIYAVTSTGSGTAGRFTLVQTPVNGTEFRQLLSGRSIALELVRTSQALVALAAGQNQTAIAQELTRRQDRAAYQEMTRSPNEASVRQGLSSLAGEVHPSMRYSAIRDARAIDAAAMDRLVLSDTGSGFWGRYLKRRGHDGYNGNANYTAHDGWGATGGIESRIGDDARVGFGAGYTDSSIHIPFVRQVGRTETVHAFGYAGGKLGPVTLRSGLGYSWATHKSNRVIAFPGVVTDPVRTRYKSKIVHLFAESSLPIVTSGGTMEPFVAYEGYRIDTDAFQENSVGISAMQNLLFGHDRKDRYNIATAGVRTEMEVLPTLKVRTRLGVQHVIGDTDIQSTVYLPGGPSFAIAGNGLARDTATTSFDLAWRPVSQVAASIGYSGTFGRRNRESGIRATLSIGF